MNDDKNDFFNHDSDHALGVTIIYTRFMQNRP